MSSSEIHAPIRWIAHGVNEAISFRALAWSAAIYPLMFSAPIFVLGGAPHGWQALGWMAVLSFLSAHGVVLQALRHGMAAWGKSVQQLPVAPMATLDFYRFIYERPIAEYWVFVVGSRVLWLAWIAAASAAFATLASAVPQLPALPLLGAGLIALVLGLFPFAITGGLLAVVLAAVGLIGALAGATGVVVGAYVVFIAIFLGSFVRLRAGQEVFADPDSQARDEGDEFNSPPFTYLAVPRGWLADRFRYGGMYFRARDAYVLESEKAMLARDDADQFIPFVGQVHVGGSLDNTSLAARLASKAMEPPAIAAGDTAIRISAVASAESAS